MNTATKRQVEYINILQKERILPSEALEALERCREAWRRGEFTKEAASVLIDLLKLQDKMPPTHCRVCHRRLKDEASRERGIGPVCAKRAGA